MEDLYSEIVMGAGSTMEGFHHHLEASSYNGDDNNNGDDDDDDELDGLIELGARVTNQSMNMSDLIKSQIASHPLYPQLVSAYISCQKVGAPPEIVNLLEEIGRGENERLVSSCTEIGADPQLDEFMESYCEALHRYKEELSKPFDEATVFLQDIESQLNNLCTDDNPTATATTLFVSGTSHSADETAAGSDDEPSCAEAREISVGANNCRSDREMKEILRDKYSGYLSTLRKEFLKKRKNGKLPKDARTALLDWWNNHYRWPYPTEEDKQKLSESTRLDSKQINNWFINQRKRHWKPSEDMRLALLEGVSGNLPPSFDPVDDGGGGPFA